MPERTAAKRSAPLIGSETASDPRFRGAGRRQAIATAHSALVLSTRMRAAADCGGVGPGLRRENGIDRPSRMPEHTRSPGRITDMRALLPDS